MTHHRSDRLLPVAYYLTWNTYGSWLPGDSRGWNRRDDPRLYQQDPLILRLSRESQRDPTVTLDTAQRATVRAAIDASCTKREWTVHARVVQTQHIHLVVVASMPAAQALIQLKGEATRALRNAWSELIGRRLWARQGNLWLLYSEDAVEQTVRYVFDDHHGPLAGHDGLRAVDGTEARRP